MGFSQIAVWRFWLDE